MPRALLSVSDKTGIVDLGRGLAARGFELVSTGGTARALTEAGLAVTSVSDVTGFPEMMDGRVKTLHPALHGGILARRDRPDDLAALAAHGIGLVDVVVVNLYPFVEAAANPATPFDALVEEIDIGGPSLVRAAAKNFRGVLVVVDPADYPRAARGARRDGPTLGVPLRADAQGASRTPRRTTRRSPRRWRRSTLNGDAFERAAAPARRSPQRLDAVAREDPRPALRREPAPAGGLVSATRTAATSASGFGAADDPAGQGAVVHEPARSRCRRAHRARVRRAGGGRSSSTRTRAAPRSATSAADAYVRARDADSLAAFGGIVALNRPIDVAAAEAIVVDVHRSGDRAGGRRGGARRSWRARPNMRVVTADFDALASAAASSSARFSARCWRRSATASSKRAQPWTPRSLPEGCASSPGASRPPDEWEALRFAWRICAHVKSNTVIFTDAQRGRWRSAPGR